MTDVSSVGHTKAPLITVSCLFDMWPKVVPSVIFETKFKLDPVIYWFSFMTDVSSIGRTKAHLNIVLSLYFASYVTEGTTFGHIWN